MTEQLRRNLRGRGDDLLIAGLTILAMVYIGTGPKAWSDERWGRAAGALAAAVGFVKTGRLSGEHEGWDKGFNTINPALRMAEPVADALAAHAVSRRVHAAADAWEQFTDRTPQPPIPEATPLDLESALQLLSDDQLRDLARQRGRGGDRLKQADRSDVIARLLS